MPLSSPAGDRPDITSWPALPFDEWKDTCATLRMRRQIVVKVRHVHTLWGSFDLAVTRFSQALALPHPGGVPNCPDWVTRDAYSHEVCNCGFWPGNEPSPNTVVYAYAYAQPNGLGMARVRPDAATRDQAFDEFMLAYDAVRESQRPHALLLDFFQSTYEAAAEPGKRRRNEREYHGPQPERADI